MGNEYAGDGPDDMPQEEQAALLTEPAFDHRIEDEAELLLAEFGAPDENGWYGRGDE
jgi:hypothetical protein